MSVPSMPLPLLLPLALGALLLVGARLPLSVQRFIGLLGTLCVLAAALDLLALTAQGDVLATAIGGWPPPFGIVLVCDRLSSLMLTLTGLLGTAFALIGAIGLARLPDFFTRLHGPTKATTLGIGAMLVASSLHFSTQGEGLALHELLITVFLFMTAPVSANLLAKAALHLRVRSIAAIPRAFRDS